MYYENGNSFVGKKIIDYFTYTNMALQPMCRRTVSTYTVQKGYSFWLIAYKQGCTMRELEMLNNKSGFSLIHPRDELIVVNFALYLYKQP